MNGFNPRNDLHDILQTNMNLGITMSNNYNLNKLNFMNSVTLNGSNLALGTTSYTQLSGIGGSVFNFNYGATNLNLSITSSSNADTLGSSGVGILQVNGVDNSYNMISEIITLTGTTQKLSTNKFQMVNSLSIISVGSNQTAVGNIFINASNNTNAHGVINAGDSVLLTGRYTIPNGYTGYLDSSILSCTTGGGAEISTFITGPSFPLQRKSSVLLYQSAVSTPGLTFNTLPQKFTTIYGANRLGSATGGSVSQRILLVPNSYIV